MIRLTFDGDPCLSEWGSISESNCNLISVILLSNKWDPSTFFASNGQHLIPPKNILPDNIPFGIGRDLTIVNIAVDPRGTADIYIDEFIRLTINIKGSNNKTRLECALPLRLSVVSHKVSPHKPLPRDDMDARAKLVAKIGRLSE
jgi:hypothetical protein